MITPHFLTKIEVGNGIGANKISSGKNIFVYRCGETVECLERRRNGEKVKSKVFVGVLPRD